MSKGKTEKEQNLLIRLDSSIAAARGAGVLILDRAGKGLGIKSKGLNDVVTEVDGKAEKYIVNFLRTRFPEDNFLGEENGEISGGSGGRWIIDPIDGTDNYIHNIPNFSISIGYEDINGVLALGVVYNPSQNELFSAMKCGGAFLNGKPIKVSDVSDPSLAISVVSPPFRNHSISSLYFKIIETIFLQTNDIRRFGSAALDLCYIACGRVDAYYEFGLHYYDIAAGLVILSEAGGSYSPFLETEDLFIDGNLIATNKFLHPWYKKQIRDILEEQSGE